MIMKKMKIVVPLLFLWVLSVPVTAWSEPCQMPDNGNGTADFPPFCPYENEEEMIVMTEGFPPGSGLYLDGPLTGFTNTWEEPGGSMGGTVALFNAQFEWHVTGFGDLEGFERQITMPLYYCEAHTAPRTPGDPVQTFLQDISRIQGGIYGDPDFEMVQIVGGIEYGLPCPGETTLTQLPYGDFSVDSFFDITYQIEFQGAPGSMLEGMAGMTTGTIRLQTERPDEEWKMHFPQWPDLTETGVDVFTEEPLTLADDFMCTQTGPITDITIWCSWKWDEFVPDITFFELGLWSDVPEGTDGYSHPGEQLWGRLFSPGEFIEEQFTYVEPGEWWFNPLSGDCFFPGDFWVWQYDFQLPLAEAFVQEEGTIYWLSVEAFQPEDPDWSLGIGWKSTDLHWNDDAVWRIMDLAWNELVYPGQHPQAGQSMDLSFVIDGPEMLEPPYIWMNIVDWTWTLHWTTVPDAVGYNVWGAEEPFAPWPSGAWTLETTTPLNSWTVPTSSAKRFFRVTAFN